MPEFNDATLAILDFVVEPVLLLCRQQKNITEQEQVAMLQSWAFFDVQLFEAVLHQELSICCCQRPPLQIQTNRARTLLNEEDDAFICIKLLTSSGDLMNFSSIWRSAKRASVSLVLSSISFGKQQQGHEIQL